MFRNFATVEDDNPNFLQNILKPRFLIPCRSNIIEETFVFSVLQWAGRYVPG